MLTRKDYIELSRIVRSLTSSMTPQIPGVNSEDCQPVEMLNKSLLVAALADYCEVDNPNFDRDKFFRACYLA